MVNKVMSSYIEQIPLMLSENALDRVRPAVRRIMNNIYVPQYEGKYRTLTSCICCKF
jgi:hypothetical protein